MRAGIQKFFYTVSLKQKIFIGYVMLILIPLSAVTAISSFRSARILEEKTQQQLGMTCDAVNGQFNTFIKDIDVISGDIISNEAVQEALKRSEAEVSAEEYISLQSKLQVEGYLQGVRIRKPGIHSVLIYGANTLHCSVSSSWSWDVTYDAREEEWFQDVIDGNGSLILTGMREEHQLFGYNTSVPRVITAARLIKDAETFETLGVLQINIDVNYLSQLGMELAKEGWIGIFDGEGNTIFTNWKEEEGEDAFVVEQISEITGWKTIYYAPRKELLKETSDTRVFLWSVAMAVTVLGLIFARFLSQSIMLPVEKLHEQMAAVSQGDFTEEITYQRQDEMGNLIDEFNQMTKKVHLLIQEIQEKEAQRRKTEIDALQARINPHFLYNTLNSIRLTAMIHKDEEITDQLTAFVYLLKVASQNGGEVIVIRQELEIIQSYCALMKYRYGNFSLEIQGGETVSEYLILPFIIQPLVENAIFHGIAALKRQGLIRITFEREKEMIRMSVSDDGAGMDSDTVKKLLAGESASSNTMNHVGMKNVLDRMRLYFGAQAHMNVESEAGKGTVILLEWPAMRMEETDAEGDDR